MTQAFWLNNRALCVEERGLWLMKEKTEQS